MHNVYVTRETFEAIWTGVHLILQAPGPHEGWGPHLIREEET
jgi:hypothetical protein